ncbi:MAG: N-acetylmuramoyl-L-alanine amidase [Rickettsiales bacterium]|nr:N-acetylmuramoyl-L-alanine amidase [Rickettsiales bacterium]
MMWRRIIAVLCLVSFIWPATGSANSIIATYVEVSPDNERVVFESESKISIINHFGLQSPSRLVIDVKRLDDGRGVGLSKAYRGSTLKNIRFGQYDPQTSRIVMDLNRMIDKPNVYTLAPSGSKKWRLVIDIDPPKRVSAAPNWPSQVTPRTKPVVPQRMPSATMPRPTNKPIQRPALRNYQAANNSAREVSRNYHERKGFTADGSVLAFIPKPAQKPQQPVAYGSKPIIIIDAGHGGKDVGAVARSGVIEKDLTLSYAKAMRDELLRTGRYQVALTREDDRFLFLKDRVRIARGYQGDVFISLHADANPNPRAEGVSVYTLSEEASDAESAALAAQENQSDVIGGISLGEADEAVADILIDLATRETKNKSSDLADQLVANMDANIPLIRNPHRFAGFRVLKAPDIPSILIEMGFLTNPRDERRLISRGYRQKVARSVVRALDDYFIEHPLRN